LRSDLSRKVRSRALHQGNKKSGEAAEYRHRNAEEHEDSSVHARADGIVDGCEADETGHMPQTLSEVFDILDTLHSQKTHSECDSDCHVQPVTGPLQRVHSFAGAQDCEGCRRRVRDIHC
jgi:hypothetical protein